MNRRWSGSVAALILSTGLAAAQAPVPASWTPPAAPVTPTPVLVNGTPVTPDPVQRKIVQAGPLKPVAATNDPVPAATATAPTPAGSVSSTTVVPGGTPAAPIDAPAVSGVSFDNDQAPYRHFWARSEYLVWFLKNMPIRPVLGSVPNADVLLPEIPAAALTTNFGGNNVDFGAQSGIRLELGIGLDPAGTWGVSGEFFQLEHASKGASFSSNSAGTPALGQLFYDPAAGREAILFASVPGLEKGGDEAVADNRLWGFEVDARRRLPTLFSDRLDFIVGYRHIGYDESLDVGSTSTLLLPIPSSAATITNGDHFGVHNDFDGAVLGLESEYDVGHFYLDLRGKFGMGNVHESWSIDGFTNFVSTDPTTPSRHFDGGVLAQPTNSGNFSRNRFDFLGEVTVNGGVRLFNDHVKAYVGYNFLGLSKVVRAGNLIDDVNPAIVPAIEGGARMVTVSAPSQKVDDGRFWAEGLNLGLSIEY